jgi:beta-mannosidase
LVRKLSYYYVKRAFAPVKLIMREESGTVQVIGINETNQPVNTKLEYGYTTFDGESVDAAFVELTLPPRSRQTVLRFDKARHDVRCGVYYAKPAIAEPALGQLLPAVLRTGTFRDLLVPAANLSISGFRRERGSARFVVSSERYAHAVHFQLDDQLRLSDEYFDLLPGESREVTIHDAPGDITAAHLRPCCIVNDCNND